MGIHRNAEGDAEDVIEAHWKDLETQEAHGVNYENYRVDEATGAAFCLFEGPNEEAGEQIHRGAHGLVADEI